jgi:hypothetical protein
MSSLHPDCASRHPQRPSMPASRRRMDRRRPWWTYSARPASHGESNDLLMVWGMTRSLYHIPLNPKSDKPPNLAAPSRAGVPRAIAGRASPPTPTPPREIYTAHKMHACKKHASDKSAYKIYARKRHTYKRHARKKHAYKITATEKHADKMPGCKKHASGLAPAIHTCTSTSVRCTPVGSASAHLREGGCGGKRIHIHTRYQSLILPPPLGVSCPLF